MGIRDRLARLEQSTNQNRRETLVIVTNDDIMDKADHAAEAQANTTGRPVIIINVTERKPEVVNRGN